MSVIDNGNAAAYGCGRYSQDVANWATSVRGDIVGHNFAVAFRNISAAEILIALADGINQVPNKDTGKFNNLRIGLITPLAAGTWLPHGAWRAFLLNSSALTATAAYSGTGNIITTVTMTGAATTYYVVEILASNISTLTFPGETTPIQIVQNSALVAASGVPVGRTAFLIYNTANAERTMVFTCAAGLASGITTANIKVHAVTPWTLRVCAAHF